MKASAKLNSINAYVAGIGASKRVVVWDTTIKGQDDPISRSCSSSATRWGTLCTRSRSEGNRDSVRIAAGGAIRRVPRDLDHGRLEHAGAANGKSAGVEDWALPALLLPDRATVVKATFVAEPITNGVSRYFEHQAEHLRGRE